MDAVWSTNCVCTMSGRLPSHFHSKHGLIWKRKCKAVVEPHKSAKPRILKLAVKNKPSSKCPFAYGQPSRMLRSRSCSRAPAPSPGYFGCCVNSLTLCQRRQRRPRCQRGGHQAGLTGASQDIVYCSPRAPPRFVPRTASADRSQDEKQKQTR